MFVKNINIYEEDWMAELRTVEPGLWNKNIFLFLKIFFLVFLNIFLFFLLFFFG